MEVAARRPSSFRAELVIGPTGGLPPFHTRSQQAPAEKEFFLLRSYDTTTAVYSKPWDMRRE
jgi:hypothetical protein